MNLKIAVFFVLVGHSNSLGIGQVSSDELNAHTATDTHREHAPRLGIDSGGISIVLLMLFQMSCQDPKTILKPLQILNQTAARVCNKLIVKLREKVPN